jgi:hypothetical protein
MTVVDGFGGPAGDSVVLAELERLAGRVRHPELGLVSFLAGPVEVGQSDPDPDEVDLVAAGASPVQVHRARLRRAAVVYAANEVVERCVDDLTLLGWDGETGLPLDEGEAGESFVWGFFPPRFRSSYTRDFAIKVLVTAGKVAYDLARPDAGPAACIAEELILNAICVMTAQVLAEAGLERPWVDPSELLLEDTDFEYLFEAGMDGIESDPAAQANLRMWIPGPADWFTPFNDERIVHPYCHSEQSQPGAHDLHPLLDQDTGGQARDPAVVDDPRPLTGLGSVSDAVRAARDEQDRSDPHLWVPDPGAPEVSYARLVALTGAGAVSGWLTWQPNRGSDAVRTQPVVGLRAHRHYPVGADQPWAEVTATLAMLHVPLAAVVAFRPDPAVRERWEQAWNAVAPGPGTP